MVIIWEDGMNIVVLKDCLYKILKNLHKIFIQLFKLISSSEIKKEVKTGAKTPALNIYF